MQSARSEEEVFDDLSRLCRSEGYVHALAYLCFRDNIIAYSGEMTAKDMLPMFSTKRLIRTEISTLIGLMVQAEVSFALPAPDVMQQYIDLTEALLEEMHHAIARPLVEALNKKSAPHPQVNPFTRGEVLRESLFYSGESAYGFQYREFAVGKHVGDDEWLVTNKGFSIRAAKEVVLGVVKLQEKKAMSMIDELRHIMPARWTMLPAYTFSVQEVAETSPIDSVTVESVLEAFAVETGERNAKFRSVHDFNVANATPLLRTGDGSFILLNTYSLVAALYESPFYWMVSDNQYQAVAMRNRGRFTETFCHERLELVFERGRVHANVDILESKGKRVGEIDVLVLFANRALIIQAKSKRLTLEARAGNDGRIREDFKKSVQDSYDQGVVCAKKLREQGVEFIDSEAQTIAVPRDLKEIYILCVVSDHYPALSFQVQQFLHVEAGDSIQPPLVLDIFALDAMTEMLQSPLYFLSYLNRRVNYEDNVFASHELIVLSYHLKQNLWIERETDTLWLSDDISADLDVAMTVRRDGIRGKATPDGILTRFTSTALGRLLKEIEANPDPRTIDFGFLLLTLSGDTVLSVSRGISDLARLASRDHRNHDLTLGFNPVGGLTVHINEDPPSAAEARLRNHCELRKYAQKADKWFGICLHPSDMSLRLGLTLDYQWRRDADMDLNTRDLPSGGSLAESLASIGRRRKVGRNDACPCGSGLKYKKCCLGK
jgi:hypothetical protein